MIKIAVATNTTFNALTLPVVIPSLINCGFEPADICIFNAGCLERSTSKYCEVDQRNLDHNSFEYSPLIDIIENCLESEYWFLLHDTCKVGPAFKHLLSQIPECKPEKIALKKFPSMSIGLYRYDYLLSVKERILAIKNCDYSEQSLDKWKTWGVGNEDYILWKTEPQPSMYGANDPKNRWRVVDNLNWYGTDSIRRTEYYPALDLYKNKSNWGQSKILKRKV